MDDNHINSIKKTSINVSRNTPVALVVGAAGFLGSGLTEKLLEKNIQVIGVDNLSTGHKRNLENAVKNGNFHLVFEDAQNLDLDIPRLDYVVIVTEGNWNIDNVLKTIKAKRARVLLISSIDLYESEVLGSELNWLKQTEGKLARFARENNLNARILRLGPVYGPGMHFRIRDPLIKLVKQALKNDLQKETSMEFSTRALFIDDALDLMIKSIFSGSTAQKIFDGSLPAPIKVSEIKQVLLDPLWYEKRSFIPQDLPPWTTPNLLKTIKFLNWQPKVNIVKALRETLSYFRDHEINIDEPADNPAVENFKKDIRKDVNLQAFKEETKKEDTKKIEAKKKNASKFKLPMGKLYLFFVLILITYALIWPAFSIIWSVSTFRHQITQTIKNLEKGEFEKGLSNVYQAEYGLSRIRDIFDSFKPFRKVNFLTNFFETGDNLYYLAEYSIISARASVLGVEELYKGLKSVTGELTDTPGEHFDQANLQLKFADEQLQRAHALLNTDKFQENLPVIFKNRVNSLESKLIPYRDLIKNSRAISELLPGLIALDGAKSYLILLQNNNELRPTGGFIGSFAKISFEGGKLKKLEVEDIYTIDGSLTLHVEPPKEIKEDLGQKDWFLRDSNWEPDFPTAARQAEWFYTKETGERVEGVIALDVSAMEDLIDVIGPLDLPDYNEKITAENLFEKAISHAELSFFPGSQGKKNFLTALSSQLFNKLIFVPNQNWPGIVGSLGRSFDEKHISIYLDNPKLFSYIVSQGWANALPREGKDEKGVVSDLIYPVEANLGANKANYYLERSYNLETVVGKDGEIRHRLRINYTNKSPSDTFPAGIYKNRMRVYLPFGTKMNRVLWGEKDITKEVESFVDYGRSGYSFLISLLPKEAKALVLDYETPQKLDFKEGKAMYRLDVIKQAGILKDPFEWNLTYPLNYTISSGQGKEIGPQAQNISTDLSRDRSFEVEFTR